MTLPIPDAVFNQDIAILGRKDSGKTYAAKLLAEHFMDKGERVIVVDPTGVWWGLRLAADGKAPGYPVVIFGGAHADVPIGDRAGAQLAEVLASRHLQAVIDLSDMDVEQKCRFVGEFLARLHARNRDSLHIIIDEADEFAPQARTDESRRSFHELDRLVRRGRIRGFLPILITQRPAALHKNVLTQASTLFAMRMPGPQDRAAVEAWVKGQADPQAAGKMLGSLAALPKGTGWVWAPDVDVLKKVAFPRLKTFDSSRTPERGERIQEPEQLGAIDLGDLASLLGAASPAALEEEKVNVDAAPLHRRIVELGAQVAALQQERDAARRDLEAARARLAKVAEIVGADAPAPPQPQADRRVAVVENKPAPARRRSSRPGQDLDGAIAQVMPAAVSPDLGGLARALLRVLIERRPTALRWAQIALLAGAKSYGPQWNMAVKQLTTADLVRDADGVVTLSPAGERLAGDAPPAPATAVELQRLWLGRLPGMASEILRALLDFGPMAPEAVALRLGKKPFGPQWNSALATLRSNGLVRGTAQLVPDSTLIAGA